MSKQQNSKTDETFRPESQADRWIKYGSNVALSVVLVILLGAGIIYAAQNLSQKFHARMDMTTGGSLSLKPQSINVVKDLKQHITLVSLYTRPDSNEEKDQTQRAQAQRVQDLLDEYKNENGKIEVKIIDPAKEKDKLEELHEEFVNRYGKQIKSYKAYLDDWKKTFDQIKKLTDDEASAVAKFAPKQAGPEDEESPIAGFVSTITDQVPDQLARARKAVDHELKKKHPDFKAAASTAREQMESVSQLAAAIAAQAPRAAAAPNLPADFRKYMTDSLPHYEQMKKLADDSVLKGSKLGELKVDQLEQALNVENPILVLGDEDWRILAQRQIWQDDTDVKALNAGAKVLPRFAGEQQVTTAIYSLENPHKQKICFIRASGQPWTQVGFPPFIPSGPASTLAERLREYNFDVTEKDLSGRWAMQAQMRQQPAAPEPSDEEIKDAIWVVLDLPAEQPNPQMPTPPAQMGQKLKEHLDHGGSALVLCDIRGETLAEALKDWGVTLQPDAVAIHETIKLTEAADVDPLEEAKARPYIWDCRNYGDHPLALPIKNLDSVFVAPILVKSSSVPGYTTTTLLPFSENMPGMKTWGKTNLEDLEKETPEFHPDKGDIPPPLFGGAVVEKKDGGRLVVIGSVRSFTNGFLRILDPRLARRDPPIRVNRFPGNMELATNSVFWLAHLEPMIAISPAAMDVSRIGDMSSGVLNFWRIGVLLILLPGAVLAAGAAVYFAPEGLICCGTGNLAHAGFEKRIRRVRLGGRVAGSSSISNASAKADPTGIQSRAFLPVPLNMNFRTTLSLLVLVVVVGIAVYFTHDKGEKPKTPETGNEHKLLDFDSADVTRVDLKSDDKHIVLQKTGSDWKLVEPVAAAAKTFEVDDLVRALTGLQSRGQVDANKKASGGLDHPSFTVELTTKSKKTAKLAFGDSGQLGDSLYVLLNDNAKPDIVSNSVYSKLDAPASNYREMKLVNATSNDIKQVSITNKGKTIKLEKNGENWQITEPAQIPAESSAMWDILSGITNLNATEFLDTPSAVAKESVAHPRLSVWFSTKTPTTQPAGADAGQMLAFGGYRDALKKSIVAALDGKEYAVVPATSAKAFEKTTLDLRNKELLTVTPELVSTITLAINRPATTQPTTKPAELREFTIERRKIAPPTLGPALPEGVTPTTAPTMKPSTQPAVATTQPTTAPAVAAAPATKPAAPQSKWFFASGDQGGADEGQVDGLLQSFHPLRVEKYHDAETVTGTSYTLTIRTVPAKASDVAETYVISIIDTGGRISASWKDVHFDVERSLVEKLTGDFKTKKAPASPPPSFQGGGRPGLPPGLGE